MPQSQGNPNDIAIDIPLTKVQTSRSTGARKATINTTNTHAEVFDEKAAMATQSQHSHFHRGAGRRKKIEEQAKGNSSPQDGTLTVMGRFYNKIYHFSVITRYMLYVAPVALMIAIPIIIGATVAPNARVGGTRMTWFCVWLEVVWCSIWVSKLVARFLPRLFQFIVGVISSGTRKYALILAALEIPLSLVGWTVTSVASFRPLMTKTPGRVGNSVYWISIIEKILFACLFSSLVLLVEKILIQLISISYHRKQFDGKIKDSKRNIYLLTRLYDASKAMFPHYCPEFAEEDYIISDTLGLNSLATPGHKRSGSATPMRLLQNVQRVGDQVANAFGNMASEITGKQIFNPTASHSIVIQALERRRSSEALARRLWLSFVLEGKDALYLEDVVEVLGSDKEDEAQETFSCLDLDGNGDISLDEMILRVSEIGRERAALANSMRDVDQAITVLDNLLMTVVFVIAVFIFVAWLNTNFTTTLATAGTALLSLSFVFSATAQELLGSCIFLFVKHPYDVGDRVDISGEQLVVERISLLYTMFRKVKDHKRTQVPNIVLNTLWVDNVSRSKAMREQISLFVSFDTSFEDIEFLRKEMQDFVLAKENARDYQPEVEIEVISMAEMNKLELKIEILHKSNWAIETVRAARRSKFMCALVLAMKKIPIYAPGGGGPAAGDKANPSYSVAISDAEAKANKEQFDKDKDAKRLVPTASKDELSSATSSGADYFAGSTVEDKELAEAQALNQRRVVIDPSGQGHEDDTSTLERRRSNDLEEIKNIMRRQSTRGRRKAATQPIATPIVEESPSYGLNASQSGERISYFEDNSFPQAQASDAPAIHVSRHSSSSVAYPAPLQTQSLGRFRSDSNVPTPKTYEEATAGNVPGNAFSQAAQSPPRNGNVPARRPVPGMGEMREYLKQPQQGGQR
ncbi:hypothetical protein H2198_008330 [Neophaeococcomyces mojaviensis]|uniref:Uncharacterized protein n=1 Tax=Neophaeococcomyces mojaviensis TaxID=3383035 RepID=A0ACC2ZXF2_9EURO|nr:hypothetical protein H2198_008330 [Knufia sp. JES_112]